MPGCQDNSESAAQAKPITPMCPVQPGWPAGQDRVASTSSKAGPRPRAMSVMVDTTQRSLPPPGVKIGCHREIPRTCQPFRLRVQIRRHAGGVMPAAS
jgi:hypothetical protein